MIFLLQRVWFNCPGLDPGIYLFKSSLCFQCRASLSSILLDTRYRANQEDDKETCSGVKKEDHKQMA